MVQDLCHCSFIVHFHHQILATLTLTMFYAFKHISTEEKSNECQNHCIKNFLICSYVAANDITVITPKIYSKYLHILG